VIKWAQFGEPTKTTKYDHGCWHDGARIAFFFGTPEQFEIDFLYGVRADDKSSTGYGLEAVPVGVFEAYQDYPGDNSPKKGGVYVATANLLQHPPEITFGANLFDWSEATVADLQKTKWTFADVKEMRKVRSPYVTFLRESVVQITGCMTAVVHTNSRGHDLAGRGWGHSAATGQRIGSAKHGFATLPAKRGPPAAKPVKGKRGGE
jgi:hypothetical protein